MNLLHNAAGVFVTGTDTGVGKTIASAVLVRALHAHYWKPAQTGLADERGDSETVAQLTQLHPNHLHAPRYALQASLAPLAAAELERVTISLEDFTLPQTHGDKIVVEGAGGVLVPLAPGVLMVDLMRKLGLPVVLVAGTGLGTINHTLLSIEALRARDIEICGVLFSGEENLGNQETIAELGKVNILGRIPVLAPLDTHSVAHAAHALS